MPTVVLLYPGYSAEDDYPALEERLATSGHGDVRLPLVHTSVGEDAHRVDALLDLVDLICVMTVNPGFGGQKFIHSCVQKVTELREMIGDREVHVEIDGGVTPATAPLVAAAGADVLGFLLSLNGQLAAAEARGETIVGPGLPLGLNPADFTTADAVRPLVGGTATGGGA